MSDVLAAGQLRAFIERIERIESDIKDMNADKSEIYKEARGIGFDVKAIRQCVAARKLDGAELEERNAMFDLYWGALQGAPHVHVHEEQPVTARNEPDREADASGEYKRVMPASVLPDLTDGDTDAGGLSRSANSSEGVPAFLLKDRKPLRPHCQHPDDLEKCAGSGRDHCHACIKAMADSEAA